MLIDALVVEVDLADVVDDAAALRAERGDADQVRVEPRPGRGVDLGDGVVDVLADVEILVAGDDDIGTIVLPGHAKPAEGDPGHSMLFGPRAINADRAAGH